MPASRATESTPSPRHECRGTICRPSPPFWAGCLRFTARSRTARKSRKLRRFEIFARDARSQVHDQPARRAGLRSKLVPRDLSRGTGTPVQTRHAHFRTPLQQRLTAISDRSSAVRRGARNRHPRAGQGAALEVRNRDRKGVCGIGGRRGRKPEHDADHVCDLGLVGPPCAETVSFTRVGGILEHGETGPARRRGDPRRAHARASAAGEASFAKNIDSMLASSGAYSLEDLHERALDGDQALAEGPLVRTLTTPWRHVREPCADTAHDAPAEVTGARVEPEHGDAGRARARAGPAPAPACVTRIFASSSSEMSKSA